MNRQTLEVVRGDSAIFDIPITTNAGVPYDLTGYTVSFTARKQGKTIQKQTDGNGIEITDAENGHSVLTLEPEDTAEIGLYRFDVQIVKDLITHTVAMGDLNIIDDVTKQLLTPVS
jgi:hypothetical protein